MDQKKQSQSPADPVRRPKRDLTEDLPDDECERERDPRDLTEEA